MAPPYFACTLGEAQQLSIKNPYQSTNINHLLDLRAVLFGGMPAVGISVPTASGERWGSNIYSYFQLHRATTTLARQLLTTHALEKAHEIGSTGNGPVVAVLSDSSWDLMCLFFAVIRIGYAVLLIAPQCDAAAVRHLLEKTGSVKLFHSLRLQGLAKASLPSGCEIDVVPSAPEIVTDVPLLPTPSWVTPDTVAYIHHTSGTSSGLPKPILQTHAAASLLLPYLPPRPAVSELTTTPLYHGGLADLMRALASCSMIWLFPPTVPVTAGNIVKALATANQALVGMPVGLFTGVPYIQQMCFESSQALDFLKRMDLVGVGGAPLPPDLGNAMVRAGVRLISRFGSSECGFLLSSFRNFGEDVKNKNGWEYLRVPYPSPYLTFEPRDGGRFELIVLKGWPQMAVCNRPDGSYATGDLFTLHPRIPRAFKYVGRADTILVLLSGKKFDTAPIEAALMAIRGVKAAIVFGEHRAIPGVLIFRHTGGCNDQVVDLHQRIMASVSSLARMGPSHARIPPEMVMLLSPDCPCVMNSKGLPIRSKVLKNYEQEIEKVYHRFEGGGTEHVHKVDVRDEAAVRRVVCDVVKKVCGVELRSDRDFFAAGVDSIMAAAIRGQLTKRLQLQQPLPANVVFEKRNIHMLVQFICSGIDSSVNDAEEHQIMHDLVKQYSVFSGVPTSRIRKVIYLEEHVVVLTGATGTLGAELIHALAQAGVGNIICLVRASSNEAAYTRVMEALEKHSLSHSPSRDTTRIFAFAATLDAPLLGLSKNTYYRLLSTATLILHVAWPVNFLLPLLSFRASLTGTYSLCALARSAGASLVFASSQAAVALASSPIRERLSANPAHAVPLGYARSKWVAEAIVTAASSEKTAVPMAILRIGQISGDTRNGNWNEKDGWPEMLRASAAIRAAPVLTHVDGWLPMDVAARVIVRLSVHTADGEGGFCRVFHVLNTADVCWSAVLRALHEVVGKFEKVRPDNWITSLEKSGQEWPLLEFWRKKYGAKDGAAGKEGPPAKWDVSGTAGIVGATFNDGYALMDETYFRMILEAWKKRGVLETFKAGKI